MTNDRAIELLDNLIGMVEDNHGSDYDAAIHRAGSKYCPNCGAEMIGEGCDG